MGSFLHNISQENYFHHINLECQKSNLKTNSIASENSALWISMRYVMEKTSPTIHSEQFQLEGARAE